MVRWGRLMGFNTHDRRQRLRDEMQSLLPTRRGDMPPSPIPGKEVTKICLRLRHLLETVIPCEVEESLVTNARSHIITPHVVELARNAGGDEYKACVVFCLLIVKKWFSKQAILELWDSDLHDVRATACEVIAKHIIEGEEDNCYLLEDVLLKRYSYVIDGDDTAPANAIEKSVDLHALRVIGSSGYQRCISFLWKGWLVQDDEDPSRFVDWKKKGNTSYWAHIDPDRMRVPAYQNALQIIISVAFLALYTGSINTQNPGGDLDAVEGLLYIFTAGFVFDEVAKLWKVGRYYFSFWSAFNSTLYALLIVSFVTRMVALSHDWDSEPRKNFNTLSYNFLAFSAPMFWMRLLLYLDTFRFFGAMLVVLKVMMKESLIFFAMLFFVLIGFFQAFIGMDQVDEKITATTFIVQSMLAAILQSPEFEGFDNFAPPFGIILYYLFTFVVMVILLNILIALYNSAYEDITDNAVDEYMALLSQKTMQYVRAPDENVFIPPFNLIEIFFLVLPFEWWLDEKSYARLNDYVMGFIYSPLLFITAALETREAHKVKFNRKRGEADDDSMQEWEELAGEVDFEAEGWDKKCEEVAPEIGVEQAVVEIRQLRREISEVREMVSSMLQ
ncbi:receptor-activated Ca2+-permeable cation channel [Phyllosticta citriasiana]|uniref:Receptor-activated Ca2+-permeable cation channel n=1 Tax=Phyllosticta citriasiana TaxID=595635 RepID=A0ABR1KYX3_9PEZI